MRDLPPRFLLRKLLAAQVRRVRNYVYAVAGGRPADDVKALVRGLLHGQEEVGTALKADDTLAPLLREHISIATEVVAALAAGDRPAEDRAYGRWATNAGQMAGALGGGAKLADCFRQYLRYVHDMAAAAHKKNWPEFAEQYRRAFNHMIRVADMLAVNGKESGT
jgi:hypothetical protein